MRRLEFLVNQCKRNADDPNGSFDDQDYVDFFNDAQETIRTEIYNAKPEAAIFSDYQSITIVQGTTNYDLADDIYAQNSVINVDITDGSSTPDGYVPIDRITDKEKYYEFGYVLQNRQIVFNPYPYDTFPSSARVHYSRKLPDLGLRAGRVQSFSSGANITLDPGYTDSLDSYADWITVVDKDGNIKQSAIALEGFAAGVISTSTVLTDVAIGDYVVLGKFSTTHSQLPDECERFLKSLVMRRIFHRKSSGDLVAQVSLTEQEREQLISLFADNQRDVTHPPITDIDMVIF